LGDKLILEHGIFTAALAIIVAMVYEQYTKKNNSFLIASIIWFSMCIPDTDYIISVVVTAVSGSPYLFEHGDFHNIFCLVGFTVIGGLWVSKKYQDVALRTAMACVSIGFFSHLVEDALVYTQAYPFFAPFSGVVFETGWMNASRDIMIYGIHFGSKKVYAIGFVLLASAVMARYAVQGSDWLYQYSDKVRFTKLCQKMGIPVNTARSVNNKPGVHPIETESDLSEKTAERSGGTV
jgi:membrane-bound metal-dependent hydrolase YbcI (DUF457 family)